MSTQSISQGLTRDGRKWEVRSYRGEDRERVRWICSETGFVGNPQEAVFIGREEFADLWSSYWTDCEPESAFVATVEGRVEGYMLGCLDTHKQEEVWNREILPRVARRLVRPAWWRHSINRKFIRAMVRSRLRHEFSAPLKQIIAEYPAHLHTNIGDPAMRGLGLGSVMMRALIAYLRQNNVKGVHLGTTSHNREALPFYEHVGFKVLHQSLFTAYDHAIPDPPLYLIYMGKKL
jgi:ribosomal protein S18 acetylase RimI-like enzyme